MPGVPYNAVNVKRLVDVADDATIEDASGGLSVSYTAAARGAYPTELKQVACVPMSQQEKMEYGVRGDLVGWKFLSFGERPYVDTRDQIDWITQHPDGSTSTHYVQVTTRDVLLYPVSNAIYQWFGQETSVES